MMDRRLVLGISSIYCLLFAVSYVKGTLTPSGTVTLDCGNQLTFTCNVTGASAVWTITGLGMITAMQSSGQLIASTYAARITTTDMRVTSSSTITITGFTTADNGGTVQCIDLNNNAAVEGMTTVSVGVPSCPTTISTIRSDDYTNATIAWQQPPNSPPVTDYTVTYCPISSPDCGNSTTCTSSPCTIRDLDPCVNYSITVISNNNCGKASGCSDNMGFFMSSQGAPGCPEIIGILYSDDQISCPSIRWKPTTDNPVSKIHIAYSPISNNGRSFNQTCTVDDLNCTAEGLSPETSYSIIITAINECGDSSQGSCKMNMEIFNTTERMCAQVQIVTPVTPLAPGELAVIIVAAAVVLIAAATTTVVVIVICCCCPAVVTCFVATCCCCCAAGSASNKQTQPAKLQPGEEYADPQTVRDAKEKRKEDKGITYAALEFSEQAGSTGGQNVRSNKGQAVQYMAVEHA